MEKGRGNTRQKIIEESMKLFSVNGFHAVSVRAIADAVGVRNSALYKHFKSKREILDAIVSYSKEYFLNMGCRQMTEIQSKEDLKKACLSMYDFQTKDKWMMMFRRLLLMEQFRDEEMAEIYRKFFIELPIETQTSMFEKLVEKGIMRNCDARVMAMELYAPFYLYHLNTDADERLRKLFEQHVENFWESYFI